MVVLDTDVLLWWLLAPDQLSPKALRACTAIEEGAGATLSSISLWEIGIKARRGKLDLGMSMREFAERVESLGLLSIEPVTTATWLRNVELEWDHRDPADRTIVALADSLGAPLVTRDEEIRRFYSRCIW